jgi:hypothetical protein
MSMGKFHHQKNVVEASLWCNPCGRYTMHRIDEGRPGPCLNPSHGRQEKLIDTSPRPAEQVFMFDDPGPLRK